MNSFLFVSMLFFVISLTLLWIFRLLSLLNYNKSIILKFFHLLIIESASLHLFITRLFFIYTLLFLVVSRFIRSFISLIRLGRTISLRTPFKSLFYCCLTSNLSLNFFCIIYYISHFNLWLFLRYNYSRVFDLFNNKLLWIFDWLVYSISLWNLLLLWHLFNFAFLWCLVWIFLIKTNFHSFNLLIRKCCFNLCHQFFIVQILRKISC